MVRQGKGGGKPNSCKTDLAMESPRLWFWENRLTLLLMVSLLYSFLLSLLHPHCQPPVEGLLRNWCHRTGKRYRDTASHNQISSKCLVACLPSAFLTMHPKFWVTHVSLRMTRWGVLIFPPIVSYLLKSFLGSPD